MFSSPGSPGSWLCDPDDFPVCFCIQWKKGDALASQVIGAVWERYQITQFSPPREQRDTDQLSPPAAQDRPELGAGETPHPILFLPDCIQCTDSEYWET